MRQQRLNFRDPSVNDRMFYDQRRKSFMGKTKVSLKLGCLSSMRGVSRQLRNFLESELSRELWTLLRLETLRQEPPQWTVYAELRSIQRAISVSYSGPEEPA